MKMALVLLLPKMKMALVLLLPNMKMGLLLLPKRKTNRQ